MKLSSTLQLFSKEVNKEIMATDIYVGIAERPSKSTHLNSDIEQCFKIFREFEASFSRFIPSNELSIFNQSFGKLTVSDDMYKLLSLSLKYYKLTNGIFDISMYPHLLKEGYVKSINEGYLGEYEEADIIENLICDLKLLDENLVFKPKGLLVEFGGIGKGYVVSKVTDYLKQSYENFIVDAGGDIYYQGKDVVNNYDYWACDIENSENTLVISSKAVATSGVNRRKWMLNSEEKNHLIDPFTKNSVINDILSVTVVSNSAVDADVMAKSLLLMGISKGLDYAEEYQIPALFIKSSADTLKSTTMNKYVWQN